MLLKAVIGRRACCVCRLDFCGAGQRVKLDPNRSVYVCNACVVEGAHPLVRKSLREGEIILPSPESATPEAHCPLGCIQRRAPGCVWTRGEGFSRDGGRGGGKMGR
jgi:hypothetical protein